MLFESGSGLRLNLAPAAGHSPRSVGVSARKARVPNRRGAFPGLPPISSEFTREIALNVPNSADWEPDWERGAP